MRPGITGLWQISGRSETSYDTRVALDTQYATNPSIWTDLRILLRTPVTVIRGLGEALRDGVVAPGPDAARHAGQIVAEAERVLGLGGGGGDAVAGDDHRPNSTQGVD